MLGGHGNVGKLRHKKSSVIRYGIEDRRKGLLPKLAKKHRIIASVGQLEDLISDLRCAHSVSEHEGKKLIDLVSLGYTKLLGSGTIRTPVLVRIDKFSKTAAAKIEAAGGRIEKATA